MRGTEATTGRILAYLEEFTARQGYSPTYREIARNVGLASISNVEYHLRQLEREGKITRERGIARTIRLLAPPTVGPCPVCGRQLAGQGGAA